MPRPSPARSALLLVHIWWPLVLGWSLVRVVSRATERTADPLGLAVLLLGIGAAYSLDRLVDAPATLGPGLRTVLVAATAAAALGGVLLLPGLPRETAVIVPLLGGVALLYPTLKRLPFSKALLVPAVWTWSTITLPFGGHAWFGWRWLLEPVAAPLFLLLASGCLLCDLKDEARDRAAGVASLPVTIGAAGATAVAVALAVAGGAWAYAEGRDGMTCSALVLSGVALRPSLLATDVVGPLVVDVILTLPGLLIAARLV